MTAATIQNIEKLIASGALYETVKDAYENALKLNTSATEAWMSYVNYEKSKENAENVKLIYQRCIPLVLNVKLAEDYVDFVISGTIPEDQNIKQVGTEAFEFAINSVGIDLESGSLWLKYAAFVSSWKSENALEDAQKIQMIRKIYHRAVSVPLNDIESVWKQYDAFENELSRSTAKQFTTEISPQYMKARLCVKPLKDFYASLFEEKYESTGAPVWTDLEKRLLKAFQRWLQWEKSDPVALQDAELLSQRVMYCIKKSLSLLRHFPEVWLDGGRFLRANGKDSEAVDFLKQGIEANSKSLLITFYATELYESVQQFDQAKILFEDLIKSYEQDYLMCRNSVESTEESMKSREKALKGTENVAEEADEESSDDDINRNNLLVNDAEYVKLKDTLMMHKKTEDILSRKLNCIWIQFMKYSRRTEGMKGARQVFSRARKTKYCSFHIFTASALFEYQCNKDKDVSFKIFEVGMKNFGDDPLYIKEYLNHLIAVADDNNVRSLCERTFSTLSGSNIVPILNEYLQYENLYGDLPSVLSIEQRLQTIAGTEPEIKLLLSRYEFLDLNDVLEKEVGFVPERRSSVAFALPISTDAMKVETGKTSIPKKRETVILPAMKDEENLYPAKKRALAYSYGSIFPKPNLNNYNSFTPEPSADGVASAESAFSSYSKSNLMAPAPGGIPQSITLLLKILPEKSQFQGPFVDPEDVVELLLAASLPPSKDYRSSKRSRREIRPLEDKEGEAKPSCAFTQALKRNVVMTDKRSLIFDPTDVNKQFMKGVPTHDNKRTKDLCYTFDRVFGEDSQQTTIYQEMVQDLVDGIFKGINCTVFSYGATGAGKSYTISGTPEKPGVMPLAMLDLFQRLESQGDFDVVVSYLEVYNETIRDLLADDAKQLDVRESDNGSVVVTNLSTHSPSNEMEVMELLEKGNRNRTKCATKANETSSRSHAVFQINLQLKSGSSGPHTRVSTGTLTLCDLAGSERASVTENKGELLREGANINRSLLALGNCINALCKLDRRRSVGHVPYRDSKLTRLLKNSLAGNCRTVMIANISPSMANLEETHNTLKYAWRAKQIKLKVKENVVDVKYNISQYLEQIEQLKDENAKLKQELAQFNHSTAPEVRSALIKGINDYYEANENITEISSFDNMSDLELVNALVTKLNGPRAKKLLQFEDNLEKENQVVKEQKPVRKSAHKRQSLLPLPQRSTRATNNMEVSRRTSLLPVPKSTKGKRKLNFTPIKKNINEVEEFLSNTGSDLFDNDVTPKARRISNQPIILSSKKLRDYVFDQERCGSPLFTK